MVTSKSTTLKKVILIALAMLLISACLYFVTGCSLFAEPDNKPDKPEVPTPGVTDPETPENARLDVINKTLYVPDRSADGYMYYKIEQRYSAFGVVDKKVVGEFDATDMQAENGYFAIVLNNLYYSETNINLTVWCFNSSSSRTGDKLTFNFLFGGKIEWDVDHCAFDNDSGEYTWTAVDNATSYAIAVNGGGYDTVVTEPKFTVDDSVYEFSVWPIFEERSLYGLSVTVSLNLSGIGQIRYDADVQAFVWSRSYDSEYTVKITDGDAVVSETALVDTDYGRGYAVFYYTPSTESVNIQVTARSKIFRPCVGDEKTFDVFRGPTDIAIGKTTGELTWNKVADFNNYTLVLEYADGSTETHNIVEKQCFSSSYSKTGAITARIRANVYSSPYISLYSEPFEFSYLKLTAFEPKIEYSAYSNKFTVSVNADTASVSAYDVTFTYESGEKTVVMDCADAVDGKVSTTLAVPLYEVIDIRVSRRFFGTEGRIYFKGDSADFTQRAISLDYPEVTVIDKNATKSSENGFKTKVTFPEALKGKGKLSVSYRYSDRTFVGGTDRQYKTNSVSDDDVVFFTRPVYRNGKNSLFVHFSGYTSNDGSSATVYGGDFDVSVGALNYTSVSYADGSKIKWEAVDGADEYVVRTSDPDGNSETFRTSETTYTHGILSAGCYWFYITPVSNRDFMMDGDTYPTAVEKLEKPIVSLDENGNFSATAPSGSVVAKLNGVERSLAKNALRNVLVSGSETALEVYCTRSTSSVQWYYLDSDVDTYTLHRISEVNSDNLGLAVDNNENIVSWTAAVNAGDYSCRLFRREDESVEFVLAGELTRGLNEIDGEPLDWGYYKLEVKPISYRVNSNYYLYLDESAEGRFNKDGIKSVSILSGGVNLVITDGLYTPDVTAAHWFVALGNKSAMVSSDTPLLTSYFESELAAITVGEHAFIVSMRYSNPASLADRKTLLPNDYVLPFEVKRSETPVVASGKYKFLDAQDNSKLNMSSVDITPVARTLKSIEHYSVVYRTKDYRPSVTATTRVSEQSGLSTTATVSDSYVNLFMLRVCSEKFIVEDGDLFYYKSSYESESNYSFAANAALVPSYTVERNTDIVRISVDFGACGYDDNDAIYVQYKGANGSWKDFFTSDMVYIKDYQSGKINFSINKSNATSDGKIVMRIMHRKKIKNGVEFDDSWWYYITAPIPDETT